jgi:hypothetical protein
MLFNIKLPVAYIKHIISPCRKGRVIKQATYSLQLVKLICFRLEKGRQPSRLEHINFTSGGYKHQPGQSRLKPAAIAVGARRI